ncbi:leucyl/phenylalanyl-tRNA--protein transferase [Halioxenophilus aromaticivorans]|uniref:Leucyl/phenylalanyl-tRNA--protein transferase n=1 Tax=Halioxenophilus aromaticivorans TaxID=1306992 RepID=A0AAV3UAT2_9ALTE
MIDIPWLDDDDSMYFPPTSSALDYPNGLLAAGGNLTSERLITAYSLGIFPWYSEGEPILWWTPSPRCVVYPSQAHCSRSLSKVIRKGTFQVTSDTCFSEVIGLCGETRQQQEGTWITQELKSAYIQLHRLGYAHSVEVWQRDTLAGGLYGLALGDVFFGESMFSLAPNASKVAFIWLAEQLQQRGYRVIDCQVTSSHLLSLGAQEIDRCEFEHLLLPLRRFSDLPKPGSLTE